MSYQSLKPLVKDPNKKMPKFGVCDIEASDWIKFLVIGYYSKIRDSETDEPLEEKFETFERMADFCAWIFSDEQPHNIIYAHFGGKYDFNFILREFYFMHEYYYIDGMIPRGSGLLCVSVSTVKRYSIAPAKTKEKNIIKRFPNGDVLIKDRTIVFKDSAALLPFSLKSLTENFGVEHKKQEIDYEQIKEVTPELLEYLEYDLKGLYQVLEKFYSWPMIKAAGATSTMASQAMRVFQTHLKTTIPSLGGGIDDFVRGAYFGGRTEIFKPLFNQKPGQKSLKTLDVNSLYPAVMRDNEFPTVFQHETKKYYAERMGFYEVDVEVPDMYIPPLGTVFDQEGDGRLIFPVGKFRGRWSTIELNYAMSLGVKILKVHRGKVFKNGGYIFKDYINELYAIRQKASKDSVDNVLCKLLMNSTYGRFGLQRERENIEFDDGQLGVHSPMEIELGKNKFIRLVKKDIVLENSFANVAIAAWVTSHARILMHKLYMKAPEALYYSDTDSLFTTHDYVCDDKDLGKLKFEYDSKNACFLLPKTYILEAFDPQFKQYDDKGKEYKSTKKVVMKGFDKKKISKFELEDFYIALEGDLRKLHTKNPAKFATFKTAIKKQKFVTMLEEQDRQIRSTYNKRKIIKTASGDFDTEPLKIEDGKIINMEQKVKKSKKKIVPDFLKP